MVATQPVGTIPECMASYGEGGSLQGALLLSRLLFWIGAVTSGLVEMLRLAAG